MAFERYVGQQQQFPDWGIGNLIDPGGFLRTISTGGNPWKPNPYGGELQGTGPGLDAAGIQLPSEDRVNNFLEMVHASNLPDNVKMQYDLSVRENPGMLDNLWANFNSELINSENAGQARIEQERLEGFRQDAQGRLNDLEGNIRPGLSGQVGRFSRDGQTLNRDFIFQDPTYAGELSAADAAINANIQRERQNMGAAFADSGVMSSGKGAGIVNSAQNQGAFDKGQIRSGLFGRAQGELDQALNQRRDFDTTLATERGNIDAGYAPQYGNLANGFRRQEIDYYMPRSSSIDELRGRQGMELAYGGLGVDAVTGLLGAADNTTQGFARMLKPGS